MCRFVHYCLQSQVSSCSAIIFDGKKINKFKAAKLMYFAAVVITDHAGQGPAATVVYGDLLGKLKSTKMSYYGRVVRKHNSLKKEVIQGCTTGISRSRGRQRRRWTDDISEWSGVTINDAARVTEDRAERREILRAANPSYGGRHYRRRRL